LRHTHPSNSNAAEFDIIKLEKPRHPLNRLFVTEYFLPMYFTADFATHFLQQQNSKKVQNNKSIFRMV